MVRRLGGPKRVVQN